MTASGQLRVTQGAQERETSDQSTDPRAHDTMVLPVSRSHIRHNHYPHNSASQNNANLQQCKIARIKIKI